MGLTTRAAIMRSAPGDWEIAELELDGPRDGEVLVRFMASGLCHSDEHVATGDAPVRFPLVGGHEGAGVVEAVGAGVSRVKVGDHIVTSFIPVCGTCRYCSTGHQNMCVEGNRAAVGCLPDETFRFHIAGGASGGGEDLGGMCVLGTFSQYAVISEHSCVAVDPEVPFDVAALVGCGVGTGWGSAVYVAGVRAGQTAVIFGVGGVGINAVQGARYAGARNVIAVDPVEFKRESAKLFGATHTATPGEQAQQLVTQVTDGVGADHAILTAGLVTQELVEQAVAIIGKGGQVTVTGIPKWGQAALQVGMMVGPQKRLSGVLFGGTNPLFDIPRLLTMYRSGDLKLDEIITRRYTLDQINEGYQDMRDGKNLRGVIIHEH
ncbi:MAG: NDMA-dependent alcohol dehydrogenase [Micromonosporaceae bacterium]|nr:NDMA-dependent alcohol dehydrogenase [Micromonosporaceae bacterium]